MQISMNFYAKFDEIRSWLIDDPNFSTLYFALAGGQPYRTEPLKKFHDLSAEDCAAWGALWIDIFPFEATLGQFKASDQYRDRLALKFPYLEGGSLREGDLATLSGDPLRLKRWRSLFRRFRARTSAGMWVLHPDTGEKGFYKPLRYSSGVLDLIGAGQQLKTMTGLVVSVDKEPRSIPPSVKHMHHHGDAENWNQ